MNTSVLFGRMLALMFVVGVVTVAAVQKNAKPRLQHVQVYQEPDDAVADTLMLEAVRSFALAQHRLPQNGQELQTWGVDRGVWPIHPISGFPFRVVTVNQECVLLDTTPGAMKEWNRGYWANGNRGCLFRFDKKGKTTVRYHFVRSGDNLILDQGS